YEEFVEKGTSHKAHEKLGAHPLRHGKQEFGTYFAVWAPNARAVSVVGDFNEWTGAGGELLHNTDAGIWFGYIPEANVGDLYKFRIVGMNGETLDKSDPYAFSSEFPTAEQPNATASRIADLTYEWNDTEWMQERRQRQSLDAPMNIYEVHIGSWRRKFENGQWRWLTYIEFAEELVPYLRARNKTHVELLPPTEHSFYPSWGYLVGSYFAPSSRYGTPEDFKRMVDYFHQNGIGVFADIVPGHFPKDAQGLSRFDGSELYAHEHPFQGDHPGWGTRIFNYGRHEVRSFLLSNSMFWLEEYHIDGLRVDAVSSMLYLNFGRKDGEWIPNQHGGHENLEAIAFLRDFNQMVHREHPGVITAAEESTAWEGITTPIEEGGLGFDYKWAMGWMHDILEYMEKEPVHRRHHQQLLTNYPNYAFSENFILPLSHDEVVHLKRSLLEKMPGNDEQRFANLRLLFGYMATMPGKKLNFMGGEIAQPAEWNPDVSLNWDVLQDPRHQGVDRALSKLDELVLNEKALHELDVDPRGFSWIDFKDAEQNVLSFRRQGMDPNETLMVVFNFSDMPRPAYRVGFPWAGRWEQVYSSNDEQFGGTGDGVVTSVNAQGIPMHE
ncbi:MAG: 1,4-alpha-glucan branching protein GlgB, partial [Anaerolineae bacterium]|nr:1,4-alpha-glucan branching protein GlgB [Anaerolineae bacterium]